LIEPVRKDRSARHATEEVAALLAAMYLDYLRVAQDRRASDRNRHRMIHSTRPWLTIPELQELIQRHANAASR
jgi:hypothetical protein